MSMCFSAMAILASKITTLGEILVGAGLIGGILLVALVARTLNNRQEARESGEASSSSNSTRRQVPVG